jgi:hypothetical protein
MEHRSPAPALPDKLERLGRYRIVRPLSKGGMALVYEARRESLAGVSPRVAIKVILQEFDQSDAFQELFINEARLGASMHHQNLVQIQDFDRDGDRFFLVMEYVEGLTFRRMVTLAAKHGLTVPLLVIAELGRQVCDGLHAAHSAKDEQGRHLALVHRDMKPSNLILNPQGVVKVLDFGISKGRLMHERKGSVKGTWGYMAPEQAHGYDVGPTADVFGLAAVLYEMAALRPLFEQKPPEELKKLLLDDHAARMATTLDPSYGPLIGVLVRALQRDPEGRFPNASDFGRALSSLLPDPITARDEVVRFYIDIDALDRGKPLPAGGRSGAGSSPGAGSHASIGATGSQIAEPASALWVIVGAGTVAMMTVGVLALGVAAVVGLGAITGHASPDSETVTTLPPTPVPDLAPPAADEPPGPAGEGAPGEDRPAPIALRGQPPAPPPQRAPSRPSPGRLPPSSTVAAPPSTPSPTTVVVPKPPDEAQFVVVHKVDPDPPPAATTPPPKPPPAAPAVVGTGRVTLSALPGAFEIWIDGKFVKSGAMARTEIPAGKHTIVLFAADGRRKEFELDVPVGADVKRIWDFDRGDFR